VNDQERSEHKRRAKQKKGEEAERVERAAAGRVERGEEVGGGQIRKVSLATYGNNWPSGQMPNDDRTVVGMAKWGEGRRTVLRDDDAERGGRRRRTGGGGGRVGGGVNENEISASQHVLLPQHLVSIFRGPDSRPESHLPE
jgi:hypothetical protein